MRPLKTLLIVGVESLISVEGEMASAKTGDAKLGNIKTKKIMGKINLFIFLKTLSFAVFLLPSCLAAELSRWVILYFSGQAI